MHLKLTRLLTVVLAVFLVGACAKGSAIEIGKPAPDFSLNDIDDKNASVSDFKGKVVILNFFATWCPPCREEIPDFITLKNEYGKDGLEIIGVSKESLGAIKELVDRLGINYPVLVDLSGSAHEIYGPIRSIPTTFIIGKDMVIKKVYIGARPREVFEEDVKELLK